MSNWSEAIAMFAPVTSVLITREKQWPAHARVDFATREVLVETECPNVFRRFELAAKAQHEHVYVQDDDCEIDIARLYRYYERVGKSMLTNAISGGHQKIYEGTNVTLIGFGCFFPRAFAQMFVAHKNEWVVRFGEEVFLNECDRMFTFAFRPHQNVLMPVREFRHNRCMSMRPGHYQLRDRIVRELNRG